MVNYPSYDGAMAGFAVWGEIIEIYRLMLFWPMFTFILKHVTLKDSMKGIISLHLFCFIISLFLASGSILIYQTNFKEGSRFQKNL